MYAELETDSCEEMQRFLAAQADHDFADITFSRKENGLFHATVNTEREPSTPEATS